MIKTLGFGGLALASLAQPSLALDVQKGGSFDALITRHAKANDVPEALVHRVIKRESRYNPRAVGRGGTMGLMQIKAGTARALGYSGSPSGLLDADTNLAYGVRYLAGAYRVANGDPNRAVAFFARGYYYDAKRKGMLPSLAKGEKPSLLDTEVEEASAVAQVEQTGSMASVFDAAPPPSFAADPKESASRSATKARSTPLAALGGTQSMGPARTARDPSARRTDSRSWEISTRLAAPSRGRPSSGTPG
jgi:hypothetical protein